MWRRGLSALSAQIQRCESPAELHGVLRLANRSQLDSVAMDSVLRNVNSSNPQVLEQVLSVAESVKLGPATLAAMFREVAAMSKVGDRIPVVLMGQLEGANLGEFSHQDLATTYFALSLANHRAGSVLDRVAEELARRRRRSADTGKVFHTPTELAKTLGSLGGVDYRGSADFTRLLEQEVERNCRGFSPSQLVQVLSSTAKLGWQANTSATSSLAAELVRRRAELSPKALSQAVFSLARLQPCQQQAPFPALPLLLDVITPPFITQLMPHELADLVWGLGKLGVLDARLLLPALRGVAPADLAKIVAAFAQLGGREISQTVQAELGNRSLGPLSRADLVSVIQSSAKLGHGDQQLLHEFESQLLQRSLRGFSLGMLVQVSGALCGAVNIDLLRKLAHEVAARDWTLLDSTASSVPVLVQLFAKARVPLPSKFATLPIDFSLVPVATLVHVTSPELGLEPPMLAKALESWPHRPQSDFAALSQPDIAQVLHAFARLPFYSGEVCSQLAARLTPGESAALAVRSLADLKHSDRVPIDLLLDDLGAYSAQSLARLVWSVTELGFPSSQQHKLAQELEKRGSSDFTPRDVSAMLLCLAKWDRRGAVAAEAIVPSSLAKFNARDLSDCVYGLTRIGAGPALAASFSREISSREGSPGFDSVYLLKDLSMWSARDTRAAGLCLARALPASALSPLQLSSAIVSLSKFHSSNGDDHVTGELAKCMDRLAGEITSRSSASPMHLVQSLQALARAKIPCRALFDRVAGIPPRQLNAQDVVSVVSSAVKLGYKDGRLFTSLVGSLPLETCPAQALGEMIAAVAQLHRLPAELFTRLASEVTRRDLSELPSTNLSQLLWVCSREEVAPLGQALFTALADQVATRPLATFNGHDLANVAQALASVRSKRFALLDAIGKEVATRGEGALTPQEVATLQRSYAQMLFYSKPLLTWTANQRNLARFAPQDLSEVMQSFARLGYRNLPFANLVAGECVQRKLAGFSTQSTVNLLYSFACLDAVTSPSVVELFTQTAAAVRPTERTYEVAQQLYQTRLAWGTGKPSALLDSMNDGKWVEALVGQYPPANTNTEAHQVLGDLLTRQRAPDFVRGAEVDLLAVDFLFPGAAKCVVELDGPRRYLCNRPSTLGGKAKFKHRLLERRGYEVISLPLLRFQTATHGAKLETAAKIAGQVQAKLRANLLQGTV